MCGMPGVSGTPWEAKPHEAPTLCSFARGPPPAAGPASRPLRRRLRALAVRSALAPLPLWAPPASGVRARYASSGTVVAQAAWSVCFRGHLDIRAALGCAHRAGLGGRQASEIRRVARRQPGLAHRERISPLLPDRRPIQVSGLAPALVGRARLSGPVRHPPIGLGSGAIERP